MTSDRLVFAAGAVVALSIVLAAVLSLSLPPALRTGIVLVIAALAVLVGMGYVLVGWIRTELADANDPSQLEFEARLDADGEGTRDGGDDPAIEGEAVASGSGDATETGPGDAAEDGS